MNEERTKVWIRSRKLKSGKLTYDVRWYDTIRHRVRSKSVGTDMKRARREAAVLEDEINRGTFQDIQRIGWDAFVTEHVARISGRANAVEAKKTLSEFGRLASPKNPRSVTYRALEAFVEGLKAKGNSPATINKRLRYIRAALNAGIKRGYLSKSPFDTSLFLPVEEPIPRIITADEEQRLLKAAEEAYGSQMKTFVVVALATGGRRGELLSLTWDRIILDGTEPHVVFTMTKSHRDRLVPLHATAVSVLRRLQAATLRDGGPFRGITPDQILKRWRHICDIAEVDGATIHDMRRTFVTRLSRAGVPLAAAQKLAGHTVLTTTMKYYTGTSEADLRDAIRKLEAATG